MINIIILHAAGYLHTDQHTLINSLYHVEKDRDIKLVYTPFIIFITVYGYFEIHLPISSEHEIWSLLSWILHVPLLEKENKDRICLPIMSSELAMQGAKLFFECLDNYQRYSFVAYSWRAFFVRSFPCIRPLKVYLLLIRLQRFRSLYCRIFKTWMK